MLRVALVGIGRLKAGPERTLAERYLERAVAAGRAIGLGVEMREIVDSRARRAEDRKAEEAAAIRALLPSDTVLIALDEIGKPMDSAGFAQFVGTRRDEGASSLALVIGGADGLDPALRREAAATIAFGAMTWPHQLVRIMAAEQIYRAVTILSGHPYHRV